MRTRRDVLGMGAVYQNDRTLLLAVVSLQSPRGAAVDWEDEGVATGWCGSLFSKPTLGLC